MRLLHGRNPETETCIRLTRSKKREQRDTTKTTRSSLGAFEQHRHARGGRGRLNLACVASLPCQTHLSPRGGGSVCHCFGQGVGWVCVVCDGDAHCRSSSHARERRRKGEGGSRRSRGDTVLLESREDRPSRVHPRLPHISSLPFSLAKVSPSSMLSPASSCDGLCAARWLRGEHDCCAGVRIVVSSHVLTKLVLVAGQQTKHARQYAER